MESVARVLQQLPAAGRERVRMDAAPRLDDAAWFTQPYDATSPLGCPTGLVGCTIHGEWGRPITAGVVSWQRNINLIDHYGESQ